MRTNAMRPMASTCMVLLLGACGGGGGGGSGPVQDDDSMAATSAGLIRDRGSPSIFQVECSRLVLDGATGNWEPLGGYARFETWIYPDAGGADVLALVNGEMIDRSRTGDDYTGYPDSRIDPRLFGCGEPMETVERVLDATRFSSTTGTEAEALLNLDGTQLEFTYYTVNGSVTGVQVGYANGKLISMVTL